MNYLNNNLLLIEEYQNLYTNGINIDLIIHKFQNKELIKHLGFDYARFRIFIDSCLLLINKKAYENYSKKQCAYRDFMTKIKSNTEYVSYIETIKKQLSISDTDVKVFYSLDGKKNTPWAQIAKIRNSMAHMQYGNFSVSGSGVISYYFIFNKDKGIRKDLGIVIEPILHELIQSFFSNYSYGLLFKYSIFSKYNFITNKKSLFYDYYEFCVKEEYLTKYDGYNSNITRKLTHIAQNENELFDFVKKNSEKFIITRKKCLKYFVKPQYLKFRRKYNLNNKKDYYYGLKTIFNFSEAISNFLAHISKLNEILYAYSINENDANVTNYNKELEKQFFELLEDENAKFSFEIGFELLKLINFILRTEDEDYPKLNYEKVDVSMFMYDENDFRKYINDRDDVLIQNYIIIRIRNAIAHGNIDISIDAKGNTIIIFTDKYNRREERIRICLNDLKLFLSQKSLYENTPKQMSFIVFNK